MSNGEPVTNRPPNTWKRKQVLGNKEPWYGTWQMNEGRSTLIMEQWEDGFELTFTKPVEPKTVGETAASVGSFTYVYRSDYGCPETDKRAEKVDAVELSADGKTLSVTVPELRKGRVYELRLEGVKSADGEPVLHPEAYYTLNELRK